MRDVEVRAGGIDLGQLLKFAGFADTGGDAKALLAEGVVRVNDEVDARRGRTLRDGDVVAVGDEEPVRVVEA
jgi:ribosome-associated protein